MDEALAIHSEEQVVLAGTGADEKHVARLERPLSGTQARAFGKRQRRVDPRVAHRVGGRRVRVAPRAAKSCGHNPDAIEPKFRIASVQPEARPDQLFGGARQVGRGHCGAG